MASLHVPPFASLHNPSCTLKKVFGKLKEISVCSLGMHIRSLWMAVCSLWMAVQSLQTEISARCVGHFSTLPSSVQHAANATAACRRETGISKEALPNHADGRTSVYSQPLRCRLRGGSDDEAEKRPFRYGALRGCLPAAQPDEASPVTERLLM